MKKAQETSSLNFLIGVVLAILMISGVGCLVYSYVDSMKTSEKSFDDLVEFFEDLEDENKDSAGEHLYYVDKYKFLVAFPAGSEEISNGVGKSCYGIPFGFLGFYLYDKSDVDIESGKIFTNMPPGMMFGPNDVPITYMAYDSRAIKKPTGICEKDKACLCLCEFTKGINLMTEYVGYEACSINNKGKCHIFEKLDFIGGEGCSHMVFVSGMIKEGVDYDRGYKSLYYNKIGNVVSVDDKQALTKDLLEKISVKYNQDLYDKINNEYTIKLDEYIAQKYPGYSGAGNCIIKTSLEKGIPFSLLAGIIFYEKWEFDKNNCKFSEMVTDKLFKQVKGYNQRYIDIIYSGKKADDVLNELYTKGYSTDDKWVEGVKTINDDIVTYFDQQNTK